MEIRHEHEISFASGKFMVDVEKNLLRLEGGRLDRVLKLRRGIFELVEDGDVMYVADRFGDVYLIDCRGCRYVLGTLCYLTGMVIHKDHIILSDKYGRIRVSERSGKIVCYRFEPHPIVALCKIKGRILSFSRHGIVVYSGYERCGEYKYELEVEKVVVNSLGGIVLLCSDSYHVFRFCEEIEFIRRVEEKVVDAVSSGPRFYKLKIDGSVEEI
jgi:hypothetical protein